jgi:ribosomal protein S18 acetylase RimI-like enzyme
VGCGALKLHRDARIAEAKRMWISPDLRGLGLGRRLLKSLVAEAESQGMAIIRLETNRSLVEAINLYEGEGFAEVEAFNNEPYAHHWFQRNLLQN